MRRRTLIYGLLRRSERALSPAGTRSRSATAIAPVRLGEGRQRTVLILLLLHRNEAVSSERLIDALWGEAPPATAAKVLQNHVGQLRRALDDREGRRLHTRGRGYLLAGGGRRARSRPLRAARGEGGEALAHDRPADAARPLREALALWRGPPLADVAYEEFAQPEIARLEERHAAALEQRIDADLALGRHADLVAELEGSSPSTRCASACARS